MFSIFSKKNKIKRLEIKRRKLLEQSFHLSRTNRAASDKKVVEADDIQRQIYDLENLQQK